MDDLAAPFRREAAVQPFQHQTGLDGDETTAARNAGGNLREEAIQTADHEIQPRTAFVLIVDGRKDSFHAVVGMDIRVVQIPRIVRKVFICQPNRDTVLGNALLRYERDEFLFRSDPSRCGQGLQTPRPIPSGF